MQRWWRQNYIYLKKRRFENGDVELSLGAPAMATPDDLLNAKVDPIFDFSRQAFLLSFLEKWLNITFVAICGHNVLSFMSFYWIGMYCLPSTVCPQLTASCPSTG